MTNDDKLVLYPPTSSDPDDVGYQIATVDGIDYLHDDADIRWFVQPSGKPVDATTARRLDAFAASATAVPVVCERCNGRPAETGVVTDPTTTVWVCNDCVRPDDGRDDDNDNDDDDDVDDEAGTADWAEAGERDGRNDAAAGRPCEPGTGGAPVWAVSAYQGGYRSGYGYEAGRGPSFKATP